MIGFLLLAPLVYVAYQMGSNKTDGAVEAHQGGKESDWISHNLYLYSETPFQNSKVAPGDHDQYSLVDPHGPVQKAMQGSASLQDAFLKMVDYEKSREKHVLARWKDFVKPHNEIMVKTTDQPITQVHILKPGTGVDGVVNTGARFWDQPVPRSTGIWNYYKPDIKVPYYEVPGER